MLTVVAIDALEHTMVEGFNMPNMKQTHYGRTNISEFSQPRTMVLWSSFMTGQNKEEEILAMGDQGMWSTRIPHGETFFSKFENPKVIDLPGYSYDLAQHDRERELLKAFFSAGDDEEKLRIRKEYNAHAFEHHRVVKDEFFKAMDEDHDFLLGYFSAADVIGHLNFGNRALMKMIYRDLDELISQVEGDVLVLSDHGMTQVGESAFGDHSEYGFWSTNFQDLGTPKITDFAEFITSRK